MNAIEVTNLTKVYSNFSGKRKVKALDDVSLAVDEGVFFGLLGPNGAGKTTLVKILLDIVKMTGGTASMLGKNVSYYKMRSDIGYLPESHRFPSYLTGGQALHYFGKMSGIPLEILKLRIESTLDLVKMTQWKKAKIKTYSKGMTQRLGLAHSLLSDPKMLILDEPTDGVDPVGRKEIRDILLELQSRGKTIFLNSHLLSEVELVADRVAILNRGKIVKEGSVKELTESGKVFNIQYDSNETLSNEFAYGSNIKARIINSTPGSLNIGVKNLEELNQLIDEIRKRGLLINSINPKKESLEEIFISLVNQTGGKG